MKYWFLLTTAKIYSWEYRTTSCSSGYWFTRYSEMQLSVLVCGGNACRAAVSNISHFSIRAPPACPLHIRHPLDVDFCWCFHFHNKVFAAHVIFIRFSVEKIWFFPRCILYVNGFRVIFTRKTKWQTSFLGIRTKSLSKGPLYWTSTSISMLYIMNIEIRYNIIQISTNFVILFRYIATNYKN